MISKEQDKKLQYSNDYLSSHKIDRVFQQVLVQLLTQRPNGQARIRSLMIQTLKNLKQKKRFFSFQDFQGMFVSHDILQANQVGYWLLNQALGKLNIEYSNSQFLQNGKKGRLCKNFIKRISKQPFKRMILLLDLIYLWFLLTVFRMVKEIKKQLHKIQDLAPIKDIFKKFVNINLNIRLVLIRIGKSKRQAFQERKGPGPGQYQDKYKFNSPKYSIGGKHIEKDNGNQIGPGQYNPAVEKKFTAGPSYSMGKQKSKSQLNPNPGPGSYQNIFQKVKSKVGYNISFGKSKRDIEKYIQSPGPGHYKQDSFNFVQSTSPKYCMGSRNKQLQNFQTPGPGNYKIDGSFSRVGGAISKSSYMTDNYNKIVPGPGAYTKEEKLRSLGGAFSKGVRQQKQRNLYPGPGSYQRQIQDQAKLAKFSKDRRDSLNISSNKIPGPGQYYSTKYWQQLSKNGRVKFSKSKRDIQVSNIVPGPGDGMTKIGKATERSFQSLVPGPGAYQYKSSVQKKNGASFSKDKRLKQQVGANPGPGQYDQRAYFADVPKYLLPGGPTKSKAYI